MALTPTQAANAAYNSVQSSTVDIIAEKVKRLFPQLNAKLGGKLDVPSDEEIIGFAKGLAKNNSGTLRNSDGSISTITVDDIDAAADNKDPSKSLKSQLNLSHRIGTAVASATQENTGSLKGATWGNAFAGFFKMIQEKGFFAAIAGVFGLLFSDGKSANAVALQSYIANETADKIKSATERNLNKIVEADPSAASTLTASRINEISGKVRDGVMEQAGFRDPETTAKRTLKDVKIGDIDGAVRDEMRSKVYDSVYAKTSKMLPELVAEEKKKTLASMGRGKRFLFRAADAVGAGAWAADTVAGKWLPSEKELGVLSHTIAKTVSTTAIDKGDEHMGEAGRLSDTLRRNLYDKLNGLVEAGALPTVARTSFDRIVDSTVENVKTELAANGKKPITATAKAAADEEKKQALGVSGGTHEDEIQSQAGGKKVARASSGKPGVQSNNSTPSVG